MSNPFATPSSLTHKAFDFAHFELKQVQPALDAAITRAKAAMSAIRQRPIQEATFTNTILALEHAFEETEHVSLIFFNLLSAHADEAMQKMAPELSSTLSTLSNDLILDGEIFARVQHVLKHRDFQKPALSSEDLQLLDNTYTDFVRNGALLDATGQEQLRALDQELARLGPKFQENTLKATNAFVFHTDKVEELAGLPPHVLEQAKKTAQQKGYKSGWALTLQAPSYQPVLQFCSHRPTRQALYMAQMRRATSSPVDNRPVLRRLVELRAERAALLGFASHADFVLQRRMAETPQRVFQFLRELLAVVKPAAESELVEIRAFAKKTAGVEKLEPWDTTYFSEQMKMQKFSLDPEALRPYFPLDHVIDGLFEHARRLYGLKVTASDRYPVYHPKVRSYELTREKDAAFVGLLYADFFPRDSKQSGAWMTNYQQQGTFRGEQRRPHVGIVCNFPEPVGEEPSLLPLREVRTLFHEFGHALHSLLSDVHHRSLSGTQVYWDFVELPSQIMENWTQQPEGLALIAKHHKTGEALPAEWVEKLEASSKYHAGLFALRQLNFALLDMAYHTTPPATWQDVEAFEREVTAEATLMPSPAGTAFSPSFGHIFAGGYSAGYYSYKWAEVLDADAFEAFRERGIFDPTTAQKFYEAILSKGGSRHPAELYRQFRGRDPDPKALLRREGFAK